MAMYGDGKTITSLGLMSQEAATNQACCAMIANRSVCEPRFMFYALKYHRADFIRIASGGAQRNLSGKLIRKFAINVPPLAEQRSIAKILGTLDDKIELNQRMNETLEATARALFKSWFVDFDPVHAKAEGRDPGVPKHIADLFPDSFEDSELGDIPKAWSIRVLGDIVNQRNERCRPSSDTSSRPYVPIDCISSKSLSLLESRPGSEAQSSLIRFYEGDILFGAMRPYFHKVCIAPFEGTTRTTAFVLFPKNTEDFAYSVFLLHARETIDFATRHSTGSTIPYAKWNASLERMQIVVPPASLRAAFNQLVTPVLRRLCEPFFENRSLSALRNALLPKLISGKIRLKVGEKITEEVF